MRKIWNVFLVYVQKSKGNNWFSFFRLALLFVLFVCQIFLHVFKLNRKCYYSKLHSYIYFFSILHSQSACTELNKNVIFFIYKTIIECFCVNFDVPCPYNHNLLLLVTLSVVLKNNLVYYIQHVAFKSLFCLLRQNMVSARTFTNNMIHFFVVLYQRAFMFICYCLLYTAYKQPQQRFAYPVYFFKLINS